MNRRQNLHCTVYSSAVSDCGKFIAVGDNFGKISILRFSRSVSSVHGNADVKLKTLKQFHAHDGAVYALLTVGEKLISAGSYPLMIWDWENLVHSEPKPLHKIEYHGLSSGTRATSLCFDEKSQMLFVAEEDGLVSVWDMKQVVCCGSLNGHRQCIHDITLLSSSLATASEDGQVMIWDTHNLKSMQTIKPANSKELKRPMLGKWISSVASDSSCEWIATGGGPAPSLWHLRSTSLAMPLECTNQPNNFVPFTLEFFENEIIGGGNDSTLHRWTANGKTRAAVPCAIPNIFRIQFAGKSSLPAVVTGTSHKVQMFSNLGYEGPCIPIS